MYPIKLASLDDIDVLMVLFRSCGKDLMDKNIPQWGDHYPIRTNIVNDLKNKTVYVIKNDEQQIVATITLDENQDPQYQAVKWKFPSLKVLVVHRLAVVPNAQNQGLATQLMSFAESIAQQKCLEVVRLDAYSLNPKALYFYEKLGYVRAIGEMQYDKIPSIFIPFEKKV